MRQNTDLHQDKCFLEEKNLVLPTNEPALFFIMDFKNNVVKVNCSKNWRNMNVYPDLRNEHSEFIERFIRNEIKFECFQNNRKNTPMDLMSAT